MVWENVESSILNMNEFSKKLKAPSNINIIAISELYPSKYDDTYYLYISFKSDDDFYCDWSFKRIHLVNDGVIIYEGNNLYDIVKFFYNDIPAVAKVPFNELKEALINKSFMGKVIKRPYSKGYYNVIIPMGVIV